MSIQVVLPDGGFLLARAGTLIVLDVSLSGAAAWLLVAMGIASLTAILKTSSTVSEVWSAQHPFR